MNTSELTSLAIIIFIYLVTDKNPLYLHFGINIVDLYHLLCRISLAHFNTWHFYVFCILNLELSLVVVSLLCVKGV